MTPSASIEYQWLSEISKKLEAEKVELIKGSKEAGWPNHLENAVSNLEATLDDIHRRMTDLDEAEAA